MKLKIAFLLLVFQIGFSQSEKSIKGIVLSDNFPIPKVDVVNFNSKMSTTTDGEGKFVLSGKIGETLIFIAKGYDIKRLVIHSDMTIKENNVVNLFKKPEELDEVLIFKIPSIRLSKDQKFEQSKLDEIDMDKLQKTLKNPGVYDGQTTGLDFFKIANMIGKLFSKEKEIVKVESPPIVFKDLVKNNFKSDVYNKILHLKEEEVSLFLEFCDADPKARLLEKSNNQLVLLDFLLLKRDEFKKL
ncbi:MAG: hypothetical protein KA278_05180 [Flavobacterium sp.]|nr:hypothetical protein [Flavobacterium sp.]